MSGFFPIVFQPRDCLVVCNSCKAYRLFVKFEVLCHPMMESVLYYSILYINMPLFGDSNYGVIQNIFEYGASALNHELMTMTLILT